MITASKFEPPLKLQIELSLIISRFPTGIANNWTAVNEAHPRTGISPSAGLFDHNRGLEMQGKLPFLGQPANCFLLQNIDVDLRTIIFKYAVEEDKAIEPREYSYFEPSMYSISMLGPDNGLERWGIKFANKNLAIFNLALVCKSLYEDMKQPGISRAFDGRNGFVFDSMNTAATYLHKLSHCEQKRIKSISIPYTHEYLAENLFQFIRFHLSNLVSIEFDMTCIFRPSFDFRGQPVRGTRLDDRRVRPLFVHEYFGARFMATTSGPGEMLNLVQIKSLENFQLKIFHLTGAPARSFKPSTLSTIMYDSDRGWSEGFKVFDVEKLRTEKKRELEEGKSMQNSN